MAENPPTKKITIMIDERIKYIKYYYKVARLHSIKTKLKSS
jgi:hypothetical protein